MVASPLVARARQRSLHNSSSANAVARAGREAVAQHQQHWVVLQQMARQAALLQLPRPHQPSSLMPGASPQTVTPSWRL